MSEVAARLWRRRALLGVLAVCVVAALGVVVVIVASPDDPAGQDEPSANGVPAPRPGETALEFVADGTPVWVVGHDDGEISVLAFATEPPEEISGQLEGVTVGTTWNHTSRQFHGGAVYDERGRALQLADDELASAEDPRARDLDHYRFEIVGDEIAIGTLVKGEERVLPDHVPGDGITGVSPDDLLTLDPDTAPLPVLDQVDQSADVVGLVLLTLPVVADGSGPVLACPQPSDGGVRPCGDDALPIRGVRAASGLDGSITAWSGPFLAHIDADGALSDLVMLDRGVSADEQPDNSTT